MSKPFPFYRYCYFITIVFITSCAQIVAPTGGPKDEVPPKVLKENPANKNTSFNEKKIIIKFDEFVQLKDADEQVVISPPMEEKPVIEVQGKNIVIETRSDLKPNTTYTINFGNSIVDNHENAVLTNYSYVFATGTYIDTLTVKGTIHNAFNDKPEKSLLVCLYNIDSFSDSTILKEKPLYFTKTTESGNYIIHNLPPHEYTMVAFKDDNKNLKYDKNESIAFYDNIVQTTDTLPLPKLAIFKPSVFARNKMIDTIGRNTGLFKFVVFNPYNVQIKPADSSTSYYTWTKAGKEGMDTVTVFSSAFKTDSVWFNYTTAEYDTAFFVKPTKNAKPIKFETAIKRVIELNDTLTITFNLPLAQAITDTSKLKLKEDTILVNPKIIYSPKADYIQLYYPLKEYTKYSIEYKDSTFMDIYGGYNKKEKASLTVKGLKDYSTLILNFVHPKDGYPYIAQMVTEDETKVFKTFIITKDERIALDYLLPAKYKIKLIRDTNRNGLWDNGDYQRQRQPEKVYYYQEVLTLRAYWDLEQTIDLNKIVD